MTTTSDTFDGWTFDADVPDGFTEDSYGNDACPMFRDDVRGLVLWIDYEDEEDREVSAPRFGLYHQDAEGMTDHARPMIDTDEWSDVLDVLARLDEGA